MQGLVLLPCAAASSAGESCLERRVLQCEQWAAAVDEGCANVRMQLVAVCVIWSIHLTLYGSSGTQLRCTAHTRQTPGPSAPKAHKRTSSSSSRSTFHGPYTPWYTGPPLLLVLASASASAERGACSERRTRRPCLTCAGRNAAQRTRSLCLLHEETGRNICILLGRSSQTSLVMAVRDRRYFRLKQNKQFNPVRCFSASLVVTPPSDFIISTHALVWPLQAL